MKINISLITVQLAKYTSLLQHSSVCSCIKITTYLTASQFVVNNNAIKYIKQCNNACFVYLNRTCWNMCWPD